MNKFRIYIKAVRKKLSRSERVVKILNLPRCSTDEPGRGFIVVQVDGLAYTQMKKTLQKKRFKRTQIYSDPDFGLYHPP